MTRECHARFCERLRGKFLRPTHLFGMKAHIGVYVIRAWCTVVETAANVNDVTQGSNLLHAQETHAWGDTGCQGQAKREERKDCDTEWHVPLRPGKRRALDPDRNLHQWLENAEKLKASIRAKVEHSLRVISSRLGIPRCAVEGWPTTACD